MNSPKSLRQIAGLTPVTMIDPASTALILIDIQNDYFDPHALPIPDGTRVVAKAASLLDRADALGLCVIHIQQVSPNPRSPIFALASNGVQIHPGVSPRPGHLLIQKHLPSSFTDTNLAATLAQRGIETLILCGLMTHMCVDSTARDALHRGYKLIIAADACASRDLPTTDGTVIDAATVHRASLAALADRFADVMSTDAVCALPAAPC